MENYSRTVKIYAKEIKKDKQTFIVCSGKIGENYYKIKFITQKKILKKK